jgi:hypothetical protein
VNVRPKHDYDGNLRPLYGDLLAIECEAISPPSAVGQTVYVFLDDDEVTQLLLELRAAAIRARR